VVYFSLRKNLNRKFCYKSAWLISHIVSVLRGSSEEDCLYNFILMFCIIFNKLILFLLVYFEQKEEELKVLFVFFQESFKRRFLAHFLVISPIERTLRKKNLLTVK